MQTNQYLAKIALVLMLATALSGCFSTQKSKIMVVDKSLSWHTENVQKPVQNAAKNPTKKPKSLAKKSSKQPKKISRKPQWAGQKSHSWVFPVHAKVSQKFSKKRQNLGLIFNTKFGQNVRAVRAGLVVYSGDKMKSHGKMIIIKHAFGFYTSYTQNHTIKVRDGDKVKKGQRIATTGKIPFYFEMKKFSEPIDPLKYLK